MTDSRGGPTTGGPDEPERERLERNWSEILQELRVIQTGTQILTGFLLTLPFQAKFSSLDGLQIGLYLGLVIGAALATALALAPVSLHRALFRRGAKAEIVATGSRLAIVTLIVVSLVLTGTVTFIFDVVAGGTAAVVVGACALLVLAGLWVAIPLGVRRSVRRASGEEPR